MARPLRVAVTGAYSSGKTTLTAALARSFGSLASTVEEQPRRVIRAAGNRMMRSPEVRSYLVVAQLLRELELANRYIQVSDGSVINNIAHDRLFLDPAPSRAEILRGLAFEPYDIAFICDHRDVILEDDGERSTDPSLREELAREVVTGAHSLARSVCAVHGSENERLMTAIDLIWRLLRSRHGTSILNKSAGLVLQDKKLLVVRKRAHPGGAFITPGGRIEEYESQIQALHREMREELGVQVQNAQSFGTYYDVAEFERTPICMYAYICDVDGHPEPDREIQEALWMTHEELRTVPLGSILQRHIVPDLRKRGLL